MKMKHAKIIIRSVDSLKNDWKAALKGKKRGIQKKDEVIFTGIETVAKVFAKTRMEVLRAIILKKPNSIYELAKMLDRDFKNVHSDVKLLSEIGLIDLQETKDARNGLKPVAKFSGIELDLAA